MTSIAIDDFQFRSKSKATDALKPREGQISDEGVLEIGHPLGGATLRFLPEGYGTPLATAAALQQLAEDLDTLRDMSATDEDLAAEIASIAETIGTLAASGATDAELTAELGPIRASIGQLTSDDDQIEQAIQVLQAAANSLDATYATDAQLQAAIAQLQTQLPIRSFDPPPSPAVGQRWVELLGGMARHPWTWVWSGSEWQSEQVFVTGTGSGRISNSSAPRADLTFLPRRSGLAGYRLIEGSLVAQLAGPANWTAKLRKFAGPATLVDWIVMPGTIGQSGVVALPLPADPAQTLIPLTLGALELNLTKGTQAPDSLFVLSLQWVAVRAA
jgi:hypothetical protein